MSKLVACMAWIGWWWWAALAGNVVVFVFLAPHFYIYWTILIGLNCYTVVRLVRQRRYYRRLEREHEQFMRDLDQRMLRYHARSGYGTKMTRRVGR